MAVDAIRSNSLVSTPARRLEHPVRHELEPSQMLTTPTHRLNARCDVYFTLNEVFDVEASQAMLDKLSEGVFLECMLWCEVSIVCHAEAVRVMCTLHFPWSHRRLEVEERVRKGVKCSFFFTLNKDSRPQARGITNT